MAESCALVCVAGGQVYLDYAEALMESAREYFRPAATMEYVILEGEEGWPVGTLCRHERLLSHFPHTKYIYLADADMRFDARGGRVVLPAGHGIVATRHPGYVTTPAHDLPYERNPASACAILNGDGSDYYAGGFFGGERTAMRILLTQTTGLLLEDAANGHVPRFHDESALNRVLASWPPERTLSPSWCYPDRDEWYVQSCWTKSYPRILTALDKTRSERGER